MSNGYMRLEVWVLVCFPREFSIWTRIYMCVTL